MKFRYKVKYDPFFGWENPVIKIQRYYPLFFGIGVWLSLPADHLKNMIDYIDPDADTSPSEQLYKTLKNYGTMQEFMMKYITEISMEDLQKENIEKQLKEFVLADGDNWTTIEVKENEADG